ncbi:hypothetical protein ACFLSW_01840 [Candidatus Bipolaricaulota bacterium]
MTIEVLKPTLFVILIALTVAMFHSMLDVNEMTSGFSISAYFNNFVSTCTNQHPNWQRRDCERVVRGEIWIGMTDEMILASIGEPNSIDQPFSDNPGYEKWTYRTARYGEEVLRLQDGALLELSAEITCNACGVKPLRPIVP